MINRIFFALLVSIVCVSGTEASSFGRTAGQFGVSATGSAQYSIPIWTPPGPKGMQPHLALTYNSGAGIGTLGIGWYLSGLGAITRCNLTYAQDGTPATVGLVTTDGYCLNGNRLRLTSGTYGTTGSTYQTEIADFSNITANGTAGNGPQYFTVQGKDGLTYMYGFTDANGNGANSEVIATGTSTASMWLLSKVIDRSGNNLVINYTTLTGTAVPNTIYWTPTSSQASTYTYNLKFNYTTNVPQSSLSKYLGGTAVSNTQLLSSIAISAGSTVIKDYFLGYQASPTTGRDELISIQECADSAQSNCLLPSTVGYQNGAIGVSTTATTAESSVGTFFSARYDLNGDGIPDLIYTGSGGTTYVAFGSNSGYGTPVNTGVFASLIGNVTGGSKDGILANVSGTWWYYTWNGSSFVGTSTGLTVDSAVQYQLADVDGDGLPDLVGLYVVTVVKNGISHTTTSVEFRLNSSSSGAPSFSSTLTDALVVPNSSQLQTPDFQYSQLRRYDFNGDGRDDLVLVYGVPGNPAQIYTEELISTGTSFTVTVVSELPGTVYQQVLFGNFNDDACTDFVSNGTLYLSGCNGGIVASFPVGTPLAAMDWDGDGRTDLVVENGSTLGVYLSTGSGLSSLITTSIPYTSTCQYVTIDSNGDGLDDLGCWSSSLTYYLHNGGGQPPDLATSFTDGYGLTYSPSYIALSAASSSVYTKGTNQVFPQQDYDGPIYVAQSAVFPDGIGGTYTKSYSYTGAVNNLQGRGFQGFTTFSTVDSRNSMTDKKTYSTGYLSSGNIVPTAGTLIAEAVTQSGGANVSVGQYTLSLLTLNSTAYNERYFPYISASSVNNYEVQAGGSYNGELITTTATNYGTPDNYGNFDSVTTTVTDEDSGSPYYNQSWSTTTASTIAPNTGNWCLNLPTEVDVTNTAPGVPNITRHLTYVSLDYPNCRETEPIVESGNSTYQVTTTYGFDAFGNINSQTVTGAGMTGRTSLTNYGTTGQFPINVSNALSQVTQTNYDPNSGNLLSVTDPNGIATSWQYDPFQRKSQENRPDGTYTTWGYSNCATAGCVNSNNRMTVVKTNFTSNGQTYNIANTYLDQFSRTLVTSAQMVTGAYDRNEVQYDNLGNVHQQAAPTSFLSPTNYWTVNSYDLLNRLIETQRPISQSNPTLQTATIKYSGRTVTGTDPQGKLTTTITKVTGKLGRTQDNNGYYVNFNHDAFGSVLSVTDSLSNTLRTNVYAYGLKAFKTSLTDMDLGSRSYTVDALGEVTAYSDGLSQNFSATFDALSRMTSRTEPDLTTTWTWGTSAGNHNIGKMASISSVATAGTRSETYSYDAYGRVTDYTIVNPVDGSHSFDYTYGSTTGVLSILTYPKSASPSTYRVAAGLYYQYGILKDIYDNNTPSTIWWQANTMNPRGQITEETTEDLSGHPQIVINRSFDAVTGWLSTNQAGVSGGSGLQNESYTYDYVGNVTQRQNNNAGLTENFYYDNLYRLYSSTLNGTTNLQMCYDNTGGACTENVAGMGNITSRSDIAAGAAWTYDPARKHAVTQAGSSSYTYTYNANGNATSRNGSTISWTSYNYPSGVGTATESATFDYGADHQRWRMIYSGSSGTETTYYATPMFEEVVTSSGTDYRHYIYAGGRPVLVVSRTTAGAINVHSLLVDHQGSISSIITDATGTNDVSESFTAYGNRREASTWSGSPTSAELNTMNGVTREGYTFQTVLGSMGLNHMNGRIEDAITGRFLSPDPHGIVQTNTQSFNRYGYVNNNPLSFTDPTGFVIQFIKPGMPCKEGCSVPAGIARWPKGLAQSVFGGMGASGGSGANTGDGAFSGMTGNDAGYSDDDGIDLAALTASVSAFAAAATDAVVSAAEAALSAETSDSFTIDNTATTNQNSAAGSAQSQAAPNAQQDPNASQGDQLPEICVGPGCAPQSYRDPISGSTFPVPNGTDFQGIFQAGQNFKNNGGTRFGLGPYLGGGGKYNLQNQAAALGLPYQYFQEGANVAVGVFMSGMPDSP